MKTLLEYLNNEFDTECDSIGELIGVLLQEDSNEGVLYDLTNMLEDYNDSQEKITDDLK